VKTIIFSIGAIGRLFYRKFKNNKTYNIIGFIDNNPKLDGTTYDNKPIYLVENINDIDFDKILIGGVHYESMYNQLKELGIDDEKIEMIEDDQITYSDDIRSKDVDKIVKTFCDVMEKEKIRYYLIASSLLCLLRGDDLSKVSDVDIMLDSKEDVKKAYDIFKKYETELKIDVNYYPVENTTSFLEKGDPSFVTISSKNDPTISEPAVIDLNIIFKSDNHRFYRLGDKYIYFDKSYFEKVIYLDYKDFKIPAPLEYDKYLSETYGKDYIVPPKRWSHSRDMNLCTEEELLKIIK